MEMIDGNVQDLEGAKNDCIVLIFICFYSFFIQIILFGGWIMHVVKRILG